MSRLSWQKVWKRKNNLQKQAAYGQNAYIPKDNKSEKHQNFVNRVFGQIRNISIDRIGFLRGKKINKENLPKVFAYLCLSCFILLVVGSFIGVVMLVVVARDLPKPDRVVRREGFSTKIYDRNGDLIYDVFENQRRTPIQIYQVPDNLKNATVAIEDKDFYQHQGFDPKGYLRIPYYLLTRQKLIGGSTLTQQLVKNVLLSSERTISRKIKELILALEIETKYSKDQILQMYLNEAPYGGTAWGVEEAAQTYFGKSVSELNLIQSAFIAGLPQRPSAYSPFTGGDTYKARTKDVIRRMLEDGYINQDQTNQALKDLDNLKFSPRTGNLRAPHFVMYVKKLLEEKYGDQVVENGGLRVTTSIDLKFQEAVQEIVSTEIAKVEKYKITNGASIVMNPQTGEILAMVGSKDFDDPNYDGQVNVVLANRQPGSAIKPITYVTAFEKGFTASSLLMDTKTEFPGGTGKPPYIPVNYDGKEHGPVQLRFALGNSLNVPAVKLLSLIGLKDMLDKAYEMGLSTLEPTPKNLSRLGLSVTLGGGEIRLIDMAGAYSAFANQGYKIDPVSILKVTDKDGNVMEEYKPVEGKQVISQQEAFLISDILSDNNARALTFGQNSLLFFKDRKVAVKTGTTNDKRDNWAIGWTPQVIAGVWVGNNDNSPMKEFASGTSGATPIWRKIVTEYLKDKPIENFQVPAGIVQIEVDSISGYRAHDDFPSRQEYFIEGTEPNSDDPVHQKLKLCKSQNKLASSFDVARGDYYDKEFIIFKENDPFQSQDSVNRWQQGIDAWVAKQSDERYHPPTQYCDTTSQVYVRFDSPPDQSTQNSDFDINVDVVSEIDIAKVEIIIDGQSKSILTSEPYQLSVKLSDGTHVIKAIATNNSGVLGSQETRIGVNVPWDWQPSPTPLPNPTITPTPKISPSLTPTPTPTP